MYAQFSGPIVILFCSVNHPRLMPNENNENVKFNSRKLRFVLVDLFFQFGEKINGNDNQSSLVYICVFYIRAIAYETKKLNMRQHKLTINMSIVKCNLVFSFLKLCSITIKFNKHILCCCINKVKLGCQLA
jgi:hypothetical protein